MSIVFEHIDMHFGDVQALRDVCLEIATGDLFFLLGPSDCGKTTLLRLIAGFEEPTRGRILFDGEDVSRTPAHRRNTAMVFQGYALWPHMTVTQNIAFGLEVQGVGRSDREERVREALRVVQIDELANRKPNELSGGQQQRVALARTLVVRPTCLLLDEPLANLDAKLRRDMRSEIRRICKEAGLTAAYVTHDREEALSMADRVAVLNEGQLLQVGTPLDVYRGPADAFVAGFIGETNFVKGRALTDPGSSLRVETSFGTLVSEAETRGVTGASTGEVTLSLRPEALAIAPARGDASGGNSFFGKLADTVYLGEMSEHQVAVSDETTLKVFELNPRGEFSVGDSVVVSVSPADVVVLPG